MAVKKLTEIGVERMKPPAPGERLELVDALVSGLNLRVTPNGIKSWSFLYRLGGKQRRMSLGHHPEISLMKARAMARDAKQEIVLGNDPINMREIKILELMRKREEGLTVEQLAKDCLERHWKVKSRTWKAIEQMFENHVYPEMGNMLAADVRRRDVIAFLDKLVNAERSTAANHALSIMRKMYNWAIERDILEFNPCTNIKKPVPIKERERVLTREEIKRLWSVCEDIGYPYGPVLQLLLLTGQRRSEIATLKWSYIDLEQKIIHLPAENVKANRSHDIPLSEMAVAIMKRLPRFNGPYVFTMTHGMKAISGFGKNVPIINRKFGTEDWRIHDLRRSAATNMAELGIALTTVSRVLNHAEGGVTKIYARYSYLKEKREALNLWAEHLQKIIGDGEGGGSNIVNIQDAKKNLKKGENVYDAKKQIPAG